MFVLTGQSNMEGKGLALHLDTYKDDPLIKPTYTTLKKDGKWIVRDDVWITYPTKSGGEKHGALTVGYGTKGEDSIGPEFGFGHTVGEAIDEPLSDVHAPAQYRRHVAQVLTRRALAEAVGRAEGAE